MGKTFLQKNLTSVNEQVSFLNETLMNVCFSIIPSEYVAFDVREPP